jgi:hypothetical protein
MICGKKLPCGNELEVVIMQVVVWGDREEGRPSANLTFSPVPM